MIRSRFLRLISSITHCILTFFPLKGNKKMKSKITRNLSYSLGSLFFLLILNAATAQRKDARVAEECLQVLTDCLIHDITSPLVASRDYAYTMIAFYEAARFADSNYVSYSGQLFSTIVHP